MMCLVWFVLIFITFVNVCLGVVFKHFEINTILTFANSYLND
jgi:hypothetical protein